VTKTFEHNYEGDIFKIRVNGHKPIAVTEEHPIFTYDGTATSSKLIHIRKAEHIEKGDFLVFIKPRYGTERKRWVLGQKRKGFSGEPDGYNRTFLKYVPITLGLCRLWGYYLAEGSCTDRVTAFYFDKDELRYIEDLAWILKNSLGLTHTWITQDKRSRTRSIKISSAGLSRALVKDFGTLASGKRLPQWIYSLPKAFQQQLLIGYFNGDGGVNSRNGFVRWYEIKTISKRLAYDIRLLASQFGILPSIIQSAAYANHKDCYAIRFWGSNASLFGLPKVQKWQVLHALRNIDYGEFIGSPVMDVTKTRYEGKVHNIETESHSFMTSAFLTHNCGLHLRFTPAIRSAKTVPEICD
jgi:intein/homing endonuclease